MTASERIREARTIMRDTVRADDLAHAALVCYCPDDCNCHYPWRTNYCGCQGHESRKG